MRQLQILHVTFFFVESTSIWAFSCVIITCNIYLVLWGQTLHERIFAFNMLQKMIFDPKKKKNPFKEKEMSQRNQSFLQIYLFGIANETRKYFLTSIYNSLNYLNMQNRLFFLIIFILSLLIILFYCGKR